MKFELVLKVSKRISAQQVQDLTEISIPQASVGTQPMHIKATAAYRYELMDQATRQKVSPQTALRRGKDLEVLLNDQTVLRIEGFFDIPAGDWPVQYWAGNGEAVIGNGLIEGSMQALPAQAVANMDYYIMWPLSDAELQVASAVTGATESAGLVPVAALPGWTGALAAVGLAGAASGGGGGGEGGANTVTPTAAMQAILEDSSSAGGARNADNLRVGLAQFQAVATKVNAALLLKYQEAVLKTTTFSNPPTTAQVQAIIDKVNADALAGLSAILEDSSSDAGSRNADANKVNADQLNSVAVNVDAGLLSKYQAAIAATTSFSNPPTVAQVQAVIDKVNADAIAGLKAILEDSSSGAGAHNADATKVSLEQLNSVAVNVDAGLLSKYQAGIAESTTFSNPPTLSQVQAIVDKVNADAIAGLSAILEDSSSNAGAHNADATQVSLEQLNLVAVNVDPVLLFEYQSAIAVATDFSNPPTVAQVQAVIDKVNADAIAGLSAILEDSSATGGAHNADGVPVSLDLLKSVADNVDPALLSQYQAAIASNTTFSRPPTVSEVQAVVDKVNADALAAKVNADALAAKNAILEDSTSAGGHHNADGTKVTAAQLDAVASNVDSTLIAEYQAAIAATTSFSNPPTVAQVQAIIDKVNADALAAKNANDSSSDGQDHTPPATPNAALTTDSGSSGSDGITNSGAITAPTNTEAGATLEYRVKKDSGAFSSWSGSYTPPCDRWHGRWGLHRGSAANGRGG